MLRRPAQDLGAETAHHHLRCSEGHPVGNRAGQRGLWSRADAIDEVQGGHASTVKVGVPSSLPKQAASLVAQQ